MEKFNSIYTDVDYKAYCKRLYNNRYLWEDLLQEFYIQMLTRDKALIDKLVSENRLKYYCLKVIRNLYYLRERKNSSLKELASDNELIDMVDDKMEYKELPDLISKYPTLGIPNIKKYCYENKISYTAMKVKNCRLKKKIKLEYAHIIKT